MVAGLHKRGFLDGKRCWKLWMEAGSLRRAQSVLEGEGVRNPRTGAPPTRSAVEKAAYVWVVNNQDEARNDLRLAWLQENQTLTDEKWNEFLARVARLIYHQRPRKFDRFIASHELEAYTD